METALVDDIRRGISLPAEMAEKIDAIAAYEQRRTAFLELADRFQKSTDPTETERLREELARMTFGN